MKKHDRYMATVRNPEYLKEFEEYQSLLGRNDKKAKYLCKKIVEKWGSDTPFMPPLPYRDESYADIFFSDPDAVEEIDITIPQKPPIKLKEHAPRLSWEKTVFAVHKVMKYKKTTKDSNKERNQIDMSPFRPSFSYKGGRYLYLTVDLTKKTGEIEKQFKAIIKKYKKYMPNSNTRNKATTIDPWHVYDMHHKDGLNFSQIARVLSGMGGNPSYNEDLMAYYRQVERAYKKATRMIEQAGKEAQKKK